MEMVLLILLAAISLGNAGTKQLCNETETHVRIGYISYECEKATENAGLDALLEFEQNFTFVLNISLIQVYADWRELYSLFSTVNKILQMNVDILLVPDFIDPSDYILTSDGPEVVRVHSAVNTQSNASTEDLQLPRAQDINCVYTSPETYSKLPDVNTCITLNPNAKTKPPPLKDAADPLSSVVTSILYRLKWQTNFILYEKSSSNKIDLLTGWMSKLHLLSETYPVDNLQPNDVIKLFTNFHGRQVIDEKMNITIICHEACLKYIISIADSYDHIKNKTTALHLHSQWLLVALGDVNITNLQLLVSDLDNVALVQISDRKRDLHLTQKGILESVQGMANTMAKNMTVTEENDLCGFKEALVPEIVLRLGSPIEICQWMEIKTLLYVRGGRHFATSGYVSVTGSLYLLGDIYPNVDFGLNGRKFIVSTLEWQPFTIRGENGTYTGLAIDLLDQMAVTLNFTFQITEPADGHWGIQLPDSNQWTGLVGQLQHNEVDMTGAPLAVQAGREMVMDFIYPFYYEYSTILVRKPDPNSKKWRTLIDPIKFNVLICILMSLPVVSFVLFMVERLSPYYQREANADVHVMHTYQDAFWYLYGALLTQGGEHLPESQAGRTILSCWWIFCIIMMATYSGNLIAFLTVNKPKLDFNTLEEMVKQNTYEWGTTGGTYWVAVFETTNVELLQEIWNGIVRFNRTDPGVLSGSAKDHFRKVLGGNYAYIGDKTQLQIQTAEECDLQLISEDFLPMRYAFGLPNNSPYTNIFSHVMLDIHESGLLQIWKAKHWPQKALCNSSQISDRKSISMVDIQSAFFLVLVGIVLSVFIGIAECLFKYLKKKNFQTAHLSQAALLRHKINTVSAQK